MSVFKNIKIAIGFALATAFFSCEKFVEVDKPINTITSETAFGNEANAAASIRGVYNNLNRTTNYALGGSVSVGLGASADEFNVASATSTYYEFFINLITPSNTGNTQYFWGAFYNTIYAANKSLEELPKSTGLTSESKLKYQAEVRLVRAISYFYLVNLYGGVPLITQSDYTVNARVPRSSVDEVYQFIIDDLQFAATNLPINYINTQRFRANRFVAMALLSRVYLYRNDWINAERLATDVIEAKASNGTNFYSLDALANVFLVTSKEAILQLPPPGNNLYTWDGFAFVPAAATTIPAYQIPDEALTAFLVTDQRKANWIRTVTISGKSYNYPYKLKLRTGTGATKTEAINVIRLAEVLLIRAEARAKQDNISGAADDLDLVRARAGLLTPTSKTIDQAAMLNLIENERKLELFAELGHRWLDLKRWNKANTVLASKANWRTAAQLFPIPSTDIKANNSLIQNPGYAD